MNAALTLWNKQMQKLTAEETIGLVIQPVLWMLLFGMGMSSLMGGDNQLYIAFMAPGIIALSVLSGAIAGGSVWLNERIRGLVKEYLVAPIPRFSILLGNALTIVTKSFIQALIIFIVALLMGTQVSRNAAGWVGAIILIGGFALGFTGIALAVASKVSDSGAYHMLIMLLNLPLLFLGNALYPLENLPVWMQVTAKLNPTSYVVDGLRQLVLVDGMVMAGKDILPLWSCFAAIALFAFLGMWLAANAFKQSVMQ